jgi:hypothetical protein
MIIPVLQMSKLRASVMAQVVEHLPSKCEAQSSNPSITKKKCTTNEKTETQRD